MSYFSKMCDNEDIVDTIKNLIAAGRAEEALETFRQLSSEVMEDYRLEVLLAEALRVTGRLPEAQEHALRAVTRAPWEPSAWVVVAEIAAAIGDKKEALAAFLEAMAAGVSVMAAHRASRFAALHNLERELQQTLARVERTRSLTTTELWCLALLAQHEGRNREAAELFEISFFDDHIDAPLDFLILAFDGIREYGNKDFALTFVDRCLKAYPKNKDLLFRKAVLLRELERSVDAMNILCDIMDSLEGDDLATGLVNLAYLYSRQGEQKAALECLKKYEQCGYGRSFSLLTMAINIYAYATGDAALLRNVAEWIGEAAKAVPPFPIVIANPKPERIRIGVLSNGLGRHPVGWLTLAAFEHLDRNRFSLLCFATDERTHDPLRARFQAISDEFVVFSRRNAEECAREILKRGIDILFDLQGYSAKSISGIILRKPAVLQIKWVGMQAYTSGLDVMDGMISDNIETPKGFESFYKEKLLRMPGSYICYTPPVVYPAVGELPYRTHGYITFGYFNNLQKISDDWLEAASSILRSVPESRLVFKTRGLQDPESRQRFEERLDKFFIDRKRIVFLPFTDQVEHLNSITNVDIALDSFPYTGGLTTLECALMGVPVVSLSGTSFSARHSLSHLTHLGVPELCAANKDEFIEKAVGLARSPEQLQRYRAELRTRLLHTSGLCDGARFAAGLTAALETALSFSADDRPRCGCVSMREVEQRIPIAQWQEWQLMIAQERARDPVALDTPFAFASDAALALLALLFHRRPRRVLECGSGLSTVLLNAVAPHFGIEEIISIDDHDEWQKRIASLLPTGHRVRLITLPLQEVSWAGTRGFYYRGFMEAIGQTWRADAIIIDGPRGDFGGPAMRNRAMAGEILQRCANEKAVVVLDDAWRLTEMDAAALWLRHRVIKNWTIVDTERGLGYGDI